MTPQQIWRAAALAQIEEFRAFGYEIRPFIKPVPFPTEKKTLHIRHDNLDEPKELIRPRVPITGRVMEPIEWFPNAKVLKDEKQFTVRVKKAYELPGCKGLHYRVLMTEGKRSFIINVNQTNSEFAFWIKNSKIEKV